MTNILDEVFGESRLLVGYLETIKNMLIISWKCYLKNLKAVTLRIKFEGET
jgi:hypothetical protein